MSRPTQVISSVLIALALLATRPSVALADDQVRIRINDIDVSTFPDVRLAMSVLDAKDVPIATLSANEIYASEQGRAQVLRVEPASRAAPVALALVLDTSGSMAGRPLADAKAATAVLARTLGEGDMAAVVSFNTVTTVRQGLTSDKNALQSGLDSASAGGNTAIFDAIDRSIEVLAAAPTQARRAIVIVTDGVDNSSRVSLGAISDRIAQQAYPVYVVGLGADLDQRVLQALATASKGGKLFLAPSSADLASIYAALSQRIITQYVLSYRSDARNAPEGTPLTITVQVQRAGALLGTASTTFTVPAGHGVVASVPSASVPTTRPSITLQPTNVADGPYSPEIVGLLGAATVLSLLLWAFAIITTRSMHSRTRRRVDGLMTSTAEDVRPPRRAFVRRVIIPFFVQLTRPMSRVAGGFMFQSIQRRLRYAGEPLDLGPAEFLGLQFGSGFVGGLVMACFGILLLGPQPIWIALVALAGALVGILVPSIALDRAVKARQRAVLLALPSALDMLAMSARAGMTFDGAVSQVVHRWASPLTDEFRRMLSEFRMGRDRRDALRDMAARTGVPEVARFVNAVVQADSLGVSIAKVLRDQAAEMRVRRRQRAEESARKAPIKMLFPMVGLIFPALFVVILGPAVPKLLDIFRVTN